MKKTILTLATCGILATNINAQDNNSNSSTSDPKVRFGLRLTGQPTWFNTSDKNSTPAGAKFGFGFGLNMEFRINKVAAFLTGIGGDFEGGTYKFRNDPGQYAVYYELNTSGEFTKPVNGLGIPKSSIVKTNNIGYQVQKRTINTTYITVPVMLKLSTSEYSGLKYFGMFGGELAFRVKALATDTYYESYTYGKDTTLPAVSVGGSQSKLNLGGTDGDALAGVIRVGLNVGLGVEYRLGGSTAFFANVNYFKSFTNLMRSESKYMIYKTDPGINYYVKQSLLYNAVRINVGIMF